MADRNDPESVRQALHFTSFQVSSTTSTTGSAEPPPLKWKERRKAVMAASGDRLTRYIFMSSVAAYGDGLNHHDGDPLAPDDHPEPYVRNKAMSERMLFGCVRIQGFPWSHSVRPSFMDRRIRFIAKLFFGTGCATAADHPAGRRPSPDAVRVYQGPGARLHASDGRASGGRRAFNVANERP
jgi:hypothetical protein